MKIKISDMMDQMEWEVVELQERGGISPQRVREKTLQKIRNTPTETHFMRKISRMGIVAAVLVFCFSVTTAAGIIVKWNGFTYTDGLSRREKDALMEEAGTAYVGKVVNMLDGSVHYLDQEGNEILVLPAGEAAAYEAAGKEEAERAVIESTSLIDASTLPLIPASITEIETAEDGQFADFILGNGHMTLLHPAGENGYRLRKGDTVTIRLDADNKCYLEFGVYLNGEFMREELYQARRHCYQFIAMEDGLYQFSVNYGSAGAGMFTDCSIMVD